MPDGPGLGLFDKSVITVDSKAQNTQNKRELLEPSRKFQSANLEDISQIQGAEASVAFMDGKEGMELFGAIGADGAQGDRSRSMRQPLQA